jgi:hypothetical protein
VCGIGVVRDYYDLAKFNVVELAQSSDVHAEKSGAGGGRSATATGDSSADVYARMAD